MFLVFEKSMPKSSFPSPFSLHVLLYNIYVFSFCTTLIFLNPLLCCLCFPAVLIVLFLVLVIWDMDFCAWALRSVRVRVRVHVLVSGLLLFSYILEFGTDAQLLPEQEGM